MPNIPRHSQHAPHAHIEANISPTTFNPQVAGVAIIKGLNYLKSRWHWSGTKIAKTLHIPSNTLNTWLKNKVVPLSNSNLQPDIQAIIHLLAIHRSLEAMFENPDHQRIWLTTFHPEINHVPEKLMSESFQGLIFIRQYLDYVRGRGA